MGREVRRVPADWVHPQYEPWTGHTGHKPLLGRNYAQEAADFLEKANAEGLQEAIDWYGRAPDRSDYMPDWPEEQRTHLMMYEDTSEGTPISPAFRTPEELARWLADNGASSFGSHTASYEQWLAVCRGGWAPSMVVTGGVLQSGVEFIASADTHPKGGDGTAPALLSSAVPKADAHPLSPSTPSPKEDK